MKKKKLYSHYNSSIVFDGETFDAIGITINSKKKYERSGDKGDIVAFIPAEDANGDAEKFAEELAKRWNEHAKLKKKIRKLRAELLLFKAKNVV